MAGDASLTVLRSWLARRGHRVRSSGMRVNVDCAERIVGRLQEQLRSFHSECGEPVVLIGQSRGGSLARVLAVREPRLRLERRDARLPGLRAPGGGALGAPDRALARAARRPRAARDLFERLQGRRLLCRLPRRPPGRVSRGRATVSPSTRAAMRSSTGAPVWIPTRGSSRSTRATAGCRCTPRSSGSWTVCSTSPGPPEPRRPPEADAALPAVLLVAERKPLELRVGGSQWRRCSKWRSISNHMQSDGSVSSIDQRSAT